MKLSHSRPETVNRDSGTASDNGCWLRRIVRPRGENIIMVLTLVSLMANLVTVTELVRLENRRDSLERRVNDLENLLAMQNKPQQSPPNKQ